MGFATASRPGMKTPSDKGRNTPGSVQSDWHLANSNVSTVTTDALLNLGTSTDYQTVIPITVPLGAVSVLLRIAVTTDATTFTTDPRLRLVAADANGVPTRLDNTDNGASGIVLAIDGASTDFTANAKYWSDVVELDAYTKKGDVLGNKTLYVLVDTAAAYTDGSTAQAVEAYVKFLN